MSQLTFSEIATVRTSRSLVTRRSSPVANGSGQSRSVVVDEEAVAQGLQRQQHVCLTTDGEAVSLSDMAIAPRRREEPVVASGCKRWIKVWR
ncbi:hypothetical protein F2Q69_00022758 [Brassica cretica]|uniref:Uncharacterized protein n=1 Tax=Brassica cretica TaxID=69181 RepID=A0A8S9QI78_BRACR|nr:hypothetical protein F2Q69_00022758 [Brassica cretica]